MTSLMPVACSAKELTVDERAEAVMAAAADHLALPPSDLTPTALGCQLDDLRQRLEQRIALSPEPTDDSAATAELLISILRVQCELLDHDLSRRVRCLTEIRNALGELRGLSPREMIYAAPVVLSREFGFARTMISTVRGSVWLPQHLYIEDERADPYSRPFLEYVQRRPHPIGGRSAGDRTHPQAVRSLRAVAEGRQTNVQGDRQRLRVLWVYRRPDHRAGQGNRDAARRPPRTRRSGDDGSSRPVGGFCRVSGGGVRECGARREGRPATR